MKALIIGGGIAGLSSAVYLSSRGISCTVLEHSPKLGGRAYSFHNPKFQVNVDNGQHLMLGCYHHTLDFLKLIGAMDKISIAPRLDMNLFTKEGRLVYLKALQLPYPLDLASAFLCYNAIPFSKRLKMLPLLLQLKSIKSENLENITVLQWLKQSGQTDEMITALWEIICIGALNTSLENASAKLFLEILKEIFTKDSFSASVILPKEGLSEMYVPQSVKFIERERGSVHCSTTVVELIIENLSVTKVVTTTGEFTDFDYLILAVPMHSLSKIKNSELIFQDYKVPVLEYSSILTIHLRHNGPAHYDEFYGFIDSPLHWVFNKKSHLTTVISNADQYMESDKEILFNLVMNEIESRMGVTKEQVSDYLVIKEKRATFIPNQKNLALRPYTKTILKNTYLAGDNTDTGLPATIEGAVKSGRMVVEAIDHLS